MLELLSEPVDFRDDELRHEGAALVFESGLILLLHIVVAGAWLGWVFELAMRVV